MQGKVWGFKNDLFLFLSEGAPTKASSFEKDHRNGNFFSDAGYMKTISMECPSTSSSDVTRIVQAHDASPFEGTPNMSSVFVGG